MTTNTTRGATVEAIQDAIDWLIEAPHQSDQWERGQALKKVKAQIVREHNSHAQLVAALESLILDRELSAYRSKQLKGGLGVWDQAKSALAAARGAA